MKQDLVHSMTNRRQVLAGFGMGTAAAALGLGTVSLRAEGKEIVIGVYGSDSSNAMKQAFTDAFTAETGIAVVFDTTGPNTGKITAMMESGQVTLDMCDSNPGTGRRLGARGWLEEIDYSVVDKSKVIEGLTDQFYVCQYTSSTVFAYDKKQLGDRIPQTWADFWNTKDFPGKRALSWQSYSVLEAALMADGVPMNKVYPIDVDRALEKVRELKSECLFWRTAAQSMDMIRNGEASMCLMWNTPATKVKQQTNGNVDFHFNQGVLSTYGWLVPKGNPGGRENVMKLIAFMQSADRQVQFMKLTTNGPSNPDADKILSAEDRALSPGSAENIGKQLRLDYDWFATNYATVEPKYIAAIS
jgi:putative spermidine/putrescine transport system substrate-binding protein